MLIRTIYINKCQKKQFPCTNVGKRNAGGNLVTLSDKREGTTGG
jgi:hypothetical protein